MSRKLSKKKFGFGFSARRCKYCPRSTKNGAEICEECLKCSLCGVLNDREGSMCSKCYEIRRKIGQKIKNMKNSFGFGYTNCLYCYNRVISPNEVCNQCVRKMRTHIRSEGADDKKFSDEQIIRAYKKVEQSRREGNSFGGRKCIYCPKSTKNGAEVCDQCLKCRKCGFDNDQVEFDSLCTLCEQKEEKEHKEKIKQIKNSQRLNFGGHSCIVCDKNPREKNNNRCIKCINKCSSCKKNKKEKGLLCTDCKTGKTVVHEKYSFGKPTCTYCQIRPRQANNNLCKECNDNYLEKVNIKCDRKGCNKEVNFDYESDDGIYCSLECLKEDQKKNSFGAKTCTKCNKNSTIGYSSTCPSCLKEESKKYQKFKIKKCFVCKKALKNNEHIFCTKCVQSAPRDDDD